MSDGLAKRTWFCGSTIIITSDDCRTMATSRASPSCSNSAAIQCTVSAITSSSRTSSTSRSMTSPGSVRRSICGSAAAAVPSTTSHAATIIMVTIGTGENAAGRRRGDAGSGSAANRRAATSPQPSATALVRLVQWIALLRITMAEASSEKIRSASQEIPRLPSSHQSAPRVGTGARVSSAPLSAIRPTNATQGQSSTRTASIPVFSCQAGPTAPSHSGTPTPTTQARPSSAIRHRPAAGRSPRGSRVSPASISG